MSPMFFISLIIAIPFVVCYAVLSLRIKKRKEDRYFKRMEEAFRNANESKDKK